MGIIRYFTYYNVITFLISISYRDVGKMGGNVQQTPRRKKTWTTKRIVIKE